MNNTKKIIVLALLTSIGIILGIVESSIPIPIRVPGAKLGLSNVIQLLVIVMIGYREGILIAVLKTILIAIGTGSMASLLYSMPAAIMSTAVMILVYGLLREKFSLIGVSIFGALIHNLMQLTVAYLIIGNLSIFMYYPFLALASVVTGYFIGITAIYFKKSFKDSYIVK